MRLCSKLSSPSSHLDIQRAVDISTRNFCTTDDSFILNDNVIISGLLMMMVDANFNLWQQLPWGRCWQVDKQKPRLAASLHSWRRHHLTFQVVNLGSSRYCSLNTIRITWGQGQQFSLPWKISHSGRQIPGCVWRE